jgi:hypothetical protein
MNNEFERMSRKIIKDHPRIKKDMLFSLPTNANAEKFARLDVLMISFKAYLKNPSILIDIAPALREMHNIFKSMRREKPTLKVISGGLCKNV